MNFILIDDDTTLLFIVRKILEKAFNIQSINTFSNPEEAVKSLEENAENRKDFVVLLDLNMPLLDGFQVLEKMAEFKSNPYRVIILSSTTLQSDIDRAGSFSFVNGFLSKPLYPEKLKSLLELD